MKKILVAIAVITAIVCFNSCEENYFELPTTHTNFIDSTKSQREWLIEFYNFYNGDEWINNENWCSPYPLNTWYGIETDSNGYVTAIRLPNNNLNRNDYKQFNFNQVPYLRILDLSNNGLVFTSLPNNLEYLDISGNKCTYINLGGTRLTNLKYFDN
ncbi:MAG: leucine-rich repeat domain-containing protein [Bacteroidales bacterium]|nr:leucine-rich repeat domain-containing protein [Bacteroidales bacterium]